MLAGMHGSWPFCRVNAQRVLLRGLVVLHGKTPRENADKRKQELRGELTVAEKKNLLRERR